MNTTHKKFWIVNAPAYSSQRVEMLFPLAEITNVNGLAYFKNYPLHWSSWVDNDIVRYADIEKNPTWEEICNYASYGVLETA